MAVRTVSVELKMQIADFLRGVGEASAATKILGDEFDHLGKSSGSFSTAKPTREMQNFSRVINGALKDGKTGFQSIQSAIDDTKTHIANLQKQIHTTPGSDSLFGDLSKAQKDLRTLEGIFKTLTPAASEGGTQAGSSFVKSFATEAVQLGDVAGPVGIAFGAAIAVVAVPVVVSALTAGVAGAIGFGVIAAGALIEKNNPAIQAALAPLKKTISSTLTDAASPLQQSFVDAIHSADLFVAREGPALKGMFASVAPAVGLVTSGIESLISKLLPEFTAVGKQFSTALANPQVHAALAGAADDFANLFKVIGNNPQVIAVGFETIGKSISFVSGFLSGLINITGSVIRGFDDATAALSKFFRGDQRSEAQQLQDPLSALSLAFPDLAKNAQAAGPALHGFFTAISSGATAVAQLAQQSAAAGPDLQALESTLSATTVTADTLAGQLTDKVVGGMLAADNANNTFNKSLITVGDTIVGLGGNLTQHVKALKKTETGYQQETDAVLAAIQANLGVYDSQIAVGISAEDATKAYEKNNSALDAQVHAAGKVPPSIQKLIDKYAKVPKNVNTVLAVQGLTTAINNLDTTLRLINHLDGLTANVSVITHYKTIGRPPGQAQPSRWGNIYEPAADGLLSSAQVYTPVNPGRFMIAEPATGGEAFIPKNGDYGRSMSILSAAAGWYGAHVVDGNGGAGGGTKTIILLGGDPQGKAFLATARAVVQDNGGNPMKVFTPR